MLFFFLQEGLLFPPQLDMISFDSLLYFNFPFIITACISTLVPFSSLEFLCV